MSYRRTNFFVALEFDENLDFVKQIKTEMSFKNEIIKDLQRLITGKEIAHFLVADDEVINDKMKEEQEPVLDKIRAEIDQAAFKDVNGSKYIFVNRVNQIINKYKAESEGTKC